MEQFFDPQIGLSFLTLAFLEIILGIDNVIFISVVASKLPEEQQARARFIGLTGALLMRVALLFSIVWIIGLTKPIFSVFGHDVSWRDLILIGGGMFLLAKGTMEIHETIEGEEESQNGGSKAVFGLIILQIMALDVVFSLDSVITAVGLTDNIAVMIAAVSVAIVVMMAAAAPVSDFIHKHPTTKMLALSFLLLIGMALVADGIGFHVPRGYLYFAIGFSLLVEVLNLWARSVRRGRKTRPVPQAGA
ncbi:MAG: TerC family protein [Alphaproteobacteria bacterium]